MSNVKADFIVTADEAKKILKQEQEQRVKAEKVLQEQLAKEKKALLQDSGDVNKNHESEVVVQSQGAQQRYNGAGNFQDDSRAYEDQPQVKSSSALSQTNQQVNQKDESNEPYQTPVRQNHLGDGMILNEQGEQYAMSRFGPKVVNGKKNGHMRSFSHAKMVYGKKAERGSPTNNVKPDKSQQDFNSPYLAHMTSQHRTSVKSTDISGGATGNRNSHTAAEGASWRSKNQVEGTNGEASPQGRHKKVFAAKKLPWNMAESFDQNSKKSKTSTYFAIPEDRQAKSRKMNRRNKGMRQSDHQWNTNSKGVESLWNQEHPSTMSQTRVNKNERSTLASRSLSRNQDNNGQRNGQYLFSMNMNSPNTKSQCIPMHMNVTGPGDYSVPSFSGNGNDKVAVSNRRNAPAFSFKSRTKIPFFPQYETDFKGTQSPGVNIYKPNHRITQSSLIGHVHPKESRFPQEPTSISSIKKQIPVAYQSLRDSYQKDSGYSITESKKLTYKTSKEDQTTPGPIYRTDYLRSINHFIDRTEPKKNSSFGINREERYETVYKGMEKFYMCTQSPGPATYTPDQMGEVPLCSNSKISQRYSISKGDRGLLNSSSTRVDGPNPQYYANSNEVAKKTTMHRNGAYSMPRQDRKIDFTKFSSTHKELVTKGYY